MCFRNTRQAVYAAGFIAYGSAPTHHLKLGVTTDLFVQEFVYHGKPPSVAIRLPNFVSWETSEFSKDITVDDCYLKHPKTIYVGGSRALLFMPCGRVQIGMIPRRPGRFRVVAYVEPVVRVRSGYASVRGARWTPLPWTMTFER